MPIRSSRKALRAGVSSNHSRELGKLQPMRRASLLAGLAAGIAALLLLVASMAAPPARAEVAVDLQLVLAVDASGSVNPTRFELQKLGYAAAFRHPRVLQAIRSTSTQSIAVTMVQWTGPALQIQVVPWTLLSDEKSVHAFAAAIESSARQLYGGGTSISGAIDYGVTLFPQSPFRAARRVIDVSGDGANNAGRLSTRARDEAVRAGIGINGLPILSLDPTLDRYYEEYVIGGPGSFVIAAESYETFSDAILRKLIIEIAANDQEEVEALIRASLRNER